MTTTTIRSSPRPATSVATTMVMIGREELGRAMVVMVVVMMASEVRASGG